MLGPLAPGTDAGATTTGTTDMAAAITVLALLALLEIVDHKVRTAREPRQQY